MMREDKRDGFKVSYEGMDIDVLLSANAQRVINEKEMVKSNVYGSVVSALDFVLDYKNKTEFGIVDQDNEYTVIAAINTEGINTFIDIIHIIDNTNVFVRQGMKIVRIGDHFKNQYYPPVS